MRLPLVVTLFLALAAPLRAEAPIRFSSAMELDSLQSRVTFHLLEEAFGRIGRPFEAEFHSARRSLISSNSGETDGELYRVHNFREITGGQFANLMRIDTELQRLHLVLFVRKDANVASLDDLAGKSVAYTPGHKIYDATLGTRPGIRVVPEPDMDKAFRLMAMGRIDAVAYGRTHGGQLISAIDGLRDQVQILPLVAVRLHAFIHKDHADLIAPLEAALDEMQRDGSFTRITDRAEAAFRATISEEIAKRGDLASPRDLR